MRLAFMRRAITGLALATLLAGCGEDREDPRKANADVAEIEAMHDTPPIQPVSPEPISTTDMDKNSLFGAGCGFAPGNGLAVVFLAQANHGFIKTDDRIAALAPDKGSERLPMDGYQQYDGREFSVTLVPKRTDGGGGDGSTTLQYPGTMVIRDLKERVVYRAEGTLGCSG